MPRSRERILSAYPSTLRCGVALWKLQRGTIYEVAVGSIARKNLPGLVRDFDAHLVVLETKREANLKTHAIELPVSTRIRYAHPSWTESSLSLPPMWRFKVGPLAKNAYRMGWSELTNRMNRSVRSLNTTRFSRHWLEEGHDS